MEAKKSNIAIGAFISVALLLLFFFLIFFSGGNYFTDKERVIMYFDGSVQGLQVGAPIKLKGVDLGEVTNIEVVFLSDEQDIINVVTADIILERINTADNSSSDDIFDAAVEKGLRAQLNYQSLLTGKLYVELDFYPDTEIHLLNLQSQHREFPTKRSSMESLFSEIEDVDLRTISKNLNTVLTKFDELLDSHKIDDAIDDFSAAANSVKKTSENLNVVVAKFDAEVKMIRKDFARATQKFDQLMLATEQEIPVISAELSLSMQKLRQSLDQINTTAANIEANFSDDSAVLYEIDRTTQELSRAARSVRTLAETLEQNPEALIRGKRK